MHMERLGVVESREGDEVHNFHNDHEKYDTLMHLDKFEKKWG